jgi:CTP:molybdopterin cytidylyltransferase MocA
MGRPKALLRDASGEAFVNRSVADLLEVGCGRVVVVLGAANDEVRAVLAEMPLRLSADVETVLAPDWAEGMSASLRAGLAAADRTAYSCALVSLVDLPDVGAAVLRRVLGVVPCDPEALGRASYDGVPGHPVLLGRDHWAGVRRSASGDRGARDYLASREPALVECGDLATGRDADRPGDLPG